MTASQVVGQGFGTAIREAVPPWLVPFFVVVTELGNVGFFLALFALDYWLGDRERGAHAVAVAIGSMALITGLKAIFTAPRPPESVTVVAITGYSFPSGHALGATVAYGILAYDLDVGTARQRFGVAAVVVAVVALSRVVLGVHYARDVVAGVVVGVAFLAVAFSWTGHDPRAGFLLAAVTAVAAFAVSGASHDGSAVLGAALAALAAWELPDATPTVESTGGHLALVAGVLPLLAAAGYVGTEGTGSVVLAFVLSGVVAAGILLAPLVVRRVAGLN
jgi:membrane-associated phospholipid phosphatase